MTEPFGKVYLSLSRRSGELTRNELRVLIHLYVCRNEETKQCNPSRKTIATDIKIDKGNLSKAIIGLEKKGWILEAEDGQFTLFEASQVPTKVVEIPTERVVDSPTVVVETPIESCRNTNPHIKEIEQKMNIETTEKNLADKSARFTEQSPVAVEDKMTETAKQSPMPRSPEFKSFREVLYNFHKNRLNGVIADFAAQNSALCWLFDNGFNPDDCLALYSEMVKELKPNGWRSKVSWLTVKQDIADWISQGKPILERKNENRNEINISRNQKRTDTDVFAESADFYSNWQSEESNFVK